MTQKAPQKRRRQTTVEEIVAAARASLRDPGGLSLRAVAQRIGVTAPALYRYVEDFQDLIRLVTVDIDAETAAFLREARDRYPADDVAGRLVATATAFRRWALANREEFAVVFTNPLASPDGFAVAATADQKTGRVFTDLLHELWLQRRFPLPRVEDLDPAVASTLDDPAIPADVDAIDPEARSLIWVYMQSWVLLYGTVTLEVFGHCDPRLIEGGAMFRAMAANQAMLLGLTDDFDRLRDLINKELAENDTPF